jgi:hypothetical protein
VSGVGIPGLDGGLAAGAVGRIRERPAYAQLQERVHEIDQLKAQF